MLLLLRRMFHHIRGPKRWERWTDRSRHVLAWANGLAAADEANAIQARHILAALIDQKVSMGCQLLGLMHIDGPALRTLLAVPAAGSRPSEPTKRLPLAPDAATVIECAWKAAASLNENHAGTEHLVLGLIAVDGACASHLGQAGATSAKARSLLLMYRASLHARDRHFARALADARAAVAEWPENAESHNLLAWWYATCPVPNLRDGQKAVQHATRACALLEPPSFYMLNTLAAAWAEAGDFPQAVITQQRALECAPAEHKSRYDQMLKLLHEGRHFPPE
jgi:hypothetical protein